VLIAAKWQRHPEIVIVLDEVLSKTE
jgi:hypothetical protein